MNLVPLVVGWGILAAAVIALALYRKYIARDEDDFLHVDGHTAAQQTDMARRLEAIDHWGKILTVITAVTAVCLIAVFLYNGWLQSNQVNP